MYIYITRNSSVGDRLINPWATQRTQTFEIEMSNHVRTRHRILVEDVASGAAYNFIYFLTFSLLKKIQI